MFINLSTNHGVNLCVEISAELEKPVKRLLRSCFPKHYAPEITVSTYPAFPVTHAAIDNDFGELALISAK